MANHTTGPSLVWDHINGSERWTQVYVQSGQRYICPECVEPARDMGN